jgi:hypothetical protein
MFKIFILYVMMNKQFENSKKSACFLKCHEISAHTYEGEIGSHCVTLR